MVKCKKEPKYKTKYINLTELSEVKELLEGLQSGTGNAKVSGNTTAAPSRSTHSPAKKATSQTPSKKAKEEEREQKTVLSSKSRSVSRKPSVTKSAVGLKTPQAVKKIHSAYKGKVVIT